MTVPGGSPAFVDITSFDHGAERPSLIWDVRNVVFGDFVSDGASPRVKRPLIK